jgi:hypothetical protein
MTYSVYTCEDFKVEGNILHIWGAKEVAKVNDEVGLKTIMMVLPYNAIICPDIYLRNRDVGIIMFK